MTRPTWYKFKELGRLLFLILTTIGICFMVARAITGTRIGEPFTRPECCPCPEAPQP